MMSKMTVCDASGTPLRVIFVPSDEVEQQLANGEQARPFEEGDLPPIDIANEGGGDQ